ncbi:MAG: hypothetical protein ABFD89_30180 [Bryobacteraceae bacterium]
MEDILLTPEEVKLLVDDKRVAAIKAVRNRTGAELVAAKEACDTYLVVMKRSVEVQCASCGGTGEVVTKVTCASCNGSGKHTIIR